MTELEFTTRLAELSELLYQAKQQQNVQEWERAQKQREAEQHYQLIVQAEGEVKRIIKEMEGMFLERVADATGEAALKQEHKDGSSAL